MLFAREDTMDKPSLLTPWTLVHFLSGIVIYSFSKYYYDNLTLLHIVGIYLVIHTVYETKDMLCYNSEYFHYFYGKSPSETPEANNSFLNTIGDTIGGLLGVLVCPFIFTNITSKTIAILVNATIVLWFLLRHIQVG